MFLNCCMAFCEIMRFAHGSNVVFAHHLCLESLYIIA